MALSSQRLLIMVIAINLIMAMGYTMYEVPRTLDYTPMFTTTQIGDGMVSDVDSSVAGTLTDGTQFAGGYLNTIKMGAVVFKIFSAGIILPYGYSGLTEGGPITALMIGLIIFKIYSFAVITLELYMLIINKKSN